MRPAGKLNGGTATIDAGTLLRRYCHCGAVYSPQSSHGSQQSGGWLNHYELAFKPIGVLSAEDTGSEHVLSPEYTPPITVSSNGGKRVLTGEAQTDQGTEEAYQEETQKGVGVLNGGRVLTAEDCPGERCRWPLGAGCDRPAVPGMGMCARHEATA